jgi:hypothetical protein
MDSSDLADQDSRAQIASNPEQNAFQVLQQSHVDGEESSLSKILLQDSANMNIC